MIVIMKIAFICDLDGKYSHIFCKWLLENGHNVDIYNKLPANWQNISWDKYDLLVPMITIDDYVHDKYGRYKLVKLIEKFDLLTLNSAKSIAHSSNKYQTYKMWKIKHIKQPITYLLKDIKNWPIDREPMIIKPIFGHSGNNIYLVNNLDDAILISKRCDSDSILQEYIKKPICWRIISTPNSIIAAYEKRLPKSVVVNVDKGARRIYIKPDTRVTDLAKECVKALGGGLMGVDILEKDNEYYALEANVPFGIDETNESLKNNLLKMISSLS